MTYSEADYQRELAILAATCPGACPVETQRAWRLRLHELQLDPVLVRRAISALTAHEPRPTLAGLLAAVAAERRRERELAVPVDLGRALAANASPDPEWNAAGMEVTRLVLARKVRADDFEREHRAEYERRKAAGGNR